MAQAQTDRRVQRSRRSLKDALVELMIAKGYEAVSVSDITARADVGRSTFYAHFADKEDLLRESLQELRCHLASVPATDACPGTHPALAFSLPMLEHVEDVRALFQALVSRRNTALELVHEMLLDLVRDKLREACALKGDDLAVSAEHIVGSFLAVCSWWMTNKPKWKPTEVDEAFQRLILAGLPKPRSPSTPREEP